MWFGLVIRLVNELLQTWFYQFDEKPFLVAPWSVNTPIDDTTVTQVSTWIQFPEFPLHYWNPKLLCKLASKIRKPIEVDHLTKQSDKGTFARILVRVEINDTMKDTVHYVNEEERMMTQKVKYEWTPVSVHNGRDMDMAFRNAIVGLSKNGDRNNL